MRGLAYWRQHDRHICMDRIEVPCTALHKKRPAGHIHQQRRAAGQWLHKAPSFPEARLNGAGAGSCNIGRYRDHLIHICACVRVRMRMLYEPYMSPLSHVRPRRHRNPGPVCLHPKTRMPERAFLDLPGLIGQALLSGLTVWALPVRSS